MLIKEKRFSNEIKLKGVSLLMMLPWLWPLMFFSLQSAALEWLKLPMMVEKTPNFTSTRWSIKWIIIIIIIKSTKRKIIVWQKLVISIKKSNENKQERGRHLRDMRKNYYQWCQIIVPATIILVVFSLQLLSFEYIVSLMVVNLKIWAPTSTQLGDFGAALTSPTQHPNGWF